MIRALDKNGDILAGIFFTKTEEVAQNIASRIKLMRRENPFNLDEGIDWKKELSNPNLGRLKGQLRDIIILTPGVAFIERLDVSFIEHRQISVDAVIHTKYSDKPIQLIESI